MIRPTDPMVHLKPVREEFVPGGLGFWVHPEWVNMFPWLVHGVSGGESGTADQSRDFGLFSGGTEVGAGETWEALARGTGLGRMAHARQVHGNQVHVHRRESWGAAGGLRIVPDGDGHLTNESGILLGVVGADCVPAFLVDPVRRAVGVVHAGWRGVAVGILPTAFEKMGEEFGTRPGELILHLGPSICGACYEVGEEVFVALGLPFPGEPAPVDLRKYLGGQAVDAGVPRGSVSSSTWCTLCGDSPFFSHRGGETGRHVGFVGIRPGVG